MSQISITRALAEIKKLTETIGTDISAAKYCYVTKGLGDKQTVNGTSRKAEDLSAEIKANFQSITDKIARRSKLKNLVAVSNALTIVNIGGRDMTVAEAIERKMAIQFDQALYNHVRGQYAQSVALVERNNLALDEQVEKAVQGAYANDKGTVTVEQYNAVAEPRRAMNLAAVLDPIGIEGWQAKKQAEVNDFLMEVDFVLSESNAKTQVEV